MNKYYAYITTNPKKTAFYTGVTNDLIRRMKEHRNNRGSKEHFTGKYYCYKLVYFETFNKIEGAIKREKEIKDLSRAKKMELIKSKNAPMNTYYLS